MARIKNKALNMGSQVVEEYHFSDIDGHSITVRAVNREEAEKKAREIINKRK